jgi:hypothetical protein
MHSHTSASMQLQVMARKPHASEKMGAPDEELFKPCHIHSCLHYSRGTLLNV